MEQPTAQEALKDLEPLVGEWVLEAIGPGGERWPGETRATIEWHDSGAHLIERSTIEMPEAPNTPPRAPAAARRAAVERQDRATAPVVGVATPWR